jgi:SOS-response transcriptional repressor LexA
MLTPRLQQLIQFISDYISVHGYSPLIEEMRIGMGFKGKSVVARMIDKLEERGFVKRHHGATRGITIVGDSADIRHLPDHVLIEELLRRGRFGRLTPGQIQRVSDLSA